MSVNEKSEEDKRVDDAATVRAISEEELKRLENDQQFYREQIADFQKQFQTLGDRLMEFEVIQSRNDELTMEVVALRDTVSQWQSDRQTTESRLSEENSDLKMKLEALQNQNQILSSMTSVLDRVTNENRTLESNLESVSQSLQDKTHLIDQLKTELLDWQNKQQTPTVPESEKTEACTEPYSDWQDVQKQIDENRLLQAELEELKAHQQSQRSSEAEQVNVLTKENQTLKEQITESREALDSCRMMMEEADASRQKSEAEWTKNYDELMLSRLELERTQEEKCLLESSISFLNQALSSHNEQIDHLKIERLCLLEELEKLRAIDHMETSKVEASTETQSDDQEIKKLNDENLFLKTKLEEIYCQHQQEVQLLSDEKEESKKRLTEADETMTRLQDQIEQAEDRHRTLEAELGQLREELETAKKQSDELSNSNARQNEVLSRLQSELEESRLSLSETRDLCQKENIRNEELGQLSELKTKETQELHKEIEMFRTRQLALEEEKSNSTELEGQVLSLTQEISSSREEIAQLNEQLDTLCKERDQLNGQVTEANGEKELLRETLQAFQQQREQLVQTVQQKHQEAVSYHAETLRLAKICEELQVCKRILVLFITLNHFLKFNLIALVQARLNEQNDLEQEAARLRVEIETFKSAQLQKQAEIERLRSHHLSVEETYTQELLKSQTKERTLKESLQAAEERATEQWRLGDQLNVWQEKYRQCLVDKERLEKEKNSQEKSFDRLQHALQQLTRERERDIVLAQKDLAQKLAQAESLQNEKDSEMAMLRRKLSEAQLGLEAAGRLTQQLDKTTAALTAAKDEGTYYIIPIFLVFVVYWRRLKCFF